LDVLEQVVAAEAAVDDAVCEEVGDVELRVGPVQSTVVVSSSLNFWMDVREDCMLVGGIWTKWRQLLNFYVIDTSGITSILRTSVYFTAVCKFRPRRKKVAKGKQHRHCPPACAISTTSVLSSAAWGFCDALSEAIRLTNS
jgi:hypothetical protein